MRTACVKFVAAWHVCRTSKRRLTWEDDRQELEFRSRSHSDISIMIMSQEYGNKGGAGWTSVPGDRISPQRMPWSFVKPSGGAWHRP